MFAINLDNEYYFNQYICDIKELSETYKEIAKVSVIGKSFDNRDIHMIKIGKGTCSIICTGGVHGRETINTIVIMKIINDYCKAYYSEEYIKYYNIKDILNKTSIYFVPLLNPDGYMIALKGFSQISPIGYEHKLNSISYYEWKHNARGIDLNRNFPCKSWCKKFEGDVCAGENETIALINVFNNIPSVGYLDFHSRGKEIYYYRGAMPKEYNDTQLILAKKLQTITGYSLVNEKNEINIGDSGGNTVQYYSEYIKRPAITIETVPEEATFPLCLSYRKETYEEIRHVPIYFAQEIYSSTITS